MTSAAVALPAIQRPLLAMALAGAAGLALSDMRNMFNTIATNI
jgi:hypothetical protein